MKFDVVHEALVTVCAFKQVASVVFWKLSNLTPFRQLFLPSDVKNIAFLVCLICINCTNLITLVI